MCILAHAHKQLRETESNCYFPLHPKAVPAPRCPRHTGSASRHGGSSFSTWLLMVHIYFCPVGPIGILDFTEGKGCRMNGSDKAIRSSKQDRYLYTMHNSRNGSRNI